MYLGTRKVRSAGRTSGSIEITLPSRLQPLQGLNCRLVVRDGLQPEIVLQPDLAASQEIFHICWQKLASGLGEIGDIGDFALADFTLTLFPATHWHHGQERPPLAYTDALVLSPHPARQANRHPETVARLLASLAVAAAYRLNLRQRLAFAFGDAIAYLVTGVPVGLGTEFERGIAHQLFWNNGQAPPLPTSVLDDRLWQKAQLSLPRVYDHFCAWQADPAAYTTAREKWYRALAVERTIAPFAREVQ